MRILLKNGFIQDPINDIEGKKDILLDKGTISKIGQLDDEKVQVDETIDLNGKIILPGLMDIHTHLREPGYENKETIKTGCEAAAAGGFTKIVCMANTDPVVDNPATVEYIKAKAEKAAVNVFPAGSITENLEGKNLSEIGFLREAGVKVLSDDGRPVMNSETMRRAMEYASSFGMTIIDHCEDLNLSGEGVMNEGLYSTILGLKPIPAAAEEVMVSRDIMLAEFTDARLHLSHLSTKNGVNMLKEAKNKGLKVTGEVTPHHLFLTDAAVKGYDTDTKVNPPLRSKEDVKALKKGLQKDIIDIIATDHAPHTFEDKLGEYNYAASGISGLETAVSLIHDKLIVPGILSWKDLVNKMLINPAKILDLDIRGICKGTEADLMIFDPEENWIINPDRFKSKGKNTPFKNQEVQGKVYMTLVEGKITYDNRGGKNEIIY
ncbi:MAG: dihydroorotase [Halanaerobiaceae bacterium]